MRVTPILAALPALAVAQEQIPLAERLQGWFNKAKSYLPAPTPVAPLKVSEQIIQKSVTPFNLDNWQSNLEPASHPQDWFVFVTGGNKTCFGQCERADRSFNESVLLFSADRTSPHLGYLDCDKENVLCSAWAAAPPSVWYFKIPQASVGGGSRHTPLHIILLNSTIVNPEAIYKIHSDKIYEKAPAYEGFFHPTDSYLAKYGLIIPIGYAVSTLSVVPSWLFMIVISFTTRTFMSRRVENQRRNENQNQNQNQNAQPGRSN